MNLNHELPSGSDQTKYGQWRIALKMVVLGASAFDVAAAKAKIGEVVDFLNEWTSAPIDVDHFITTGSLGVLSCCDDSEVINFSTFDYPISIDHLSYRNMTRALEEHPGDDNHAFLRGIQLHMVAHYRDDSGTGLIPSVWQTVVTPNLSVTSPVSQDDAELITGDAMHDMVFHTMTSSGRLTVPGTDIEAILSLSVESGQNWMRSDMAARQAVYQMHYGAPMPTENDDDFDPSSAEYATVYYTTSSDGYEDDPDDDGSGGDVYEYSVDAVSEPDEEEEPDGDLLESADDGSDDHRTMVIGMDNIAERFGFHMAHKKPPVQVSHPVKEYLALRYSTTNPVESARDLSAAWERATSIPMDFASLRSTQKGQVAHVKDTVEIGLDGTRDAHDIAQSFALELRALDDGYRNVVEYGVQSDSDRLGPFMFGFEAAIAESPLSGTTTDSQFVTIDSSYSAMSHTKRNDKRVE